MELLKIVTEAREGLKLILLNGEIDMDVSPKLRDMLLEACKTSSRGVAVDLSGVSYMDSSGIATLIEGLQWSKREVRRFMLIGVQPTVMNTLKLAKLHDLFEIHATQEAALAGLG